MASKKQTDNDASRRRDIHTGNRIGARHGKSGDDIFYRTGLVISGALFAAGTFFTRMFSKTREALTQIFSEGSNLKRLYIAVACLFAAVFLFLGVWYFTNKNAVKIFINDAPLGIVNEKDVTAEKLTELVTARLEKDYGTQIELYDVINITQVHASKNDMILLDSIISEICSMADFKLLAAAIVIDGIEYCIVTSASEAAGIKENIIKAYIEPGQNIIDSDTVEEFSVRDKFVVKDDIDSTDKAYEILSSSQDSTANYTVKSGDVPEIIAQANGLSLDELQELNPGVDILGGRISIGQVLNIRVAKPFISVRTVENISYIEVEPKETEYQYNDSQPTNYTRIVRQGKDGQRQVTVEIVRINGFEVERNVVDKVITEPPVSEIIEKGTRQ